MAADILRVEEIAYTEDNISV